MSEATRVDAAFAVLFSRPCACPERHAGRPDGTCGIRAIDVMQHDGVDIAACLPCIRCLLAVEFDAPPGRASGSASRARRTG
jgi:hypothetical protein